MDDKPLYVNGQDRIRVYADDSWTKEELEHMAKGNLIDRHGKRYGVCPRCCKVVCLTKVFFGSTHFCE